MFCVVQTTIATKKEAKTLTQKLFEKGLIACAKMSKAESSYVWEHKFCEQKEYVLNFITTQKQLKAVQKALHQAHSYKLPEFIAFKVDYISTNYGEWVKKSVKA